MAPAHDLIMFHGLGCDVTGSDISGSMLAQAHKNTIGRGLSISLHRADYRDLPQHFPRQFDAVVCLSSSILHMPDEPNVLRAFASMRPVIRDEGLLVLTQGTTDKQWREKPRFILAVNEADSSRIFVIDYLERGARYNVLDVYHTEGHQEMRTWSTLYPRMLLSEDYDKLLREAGFGAVELYGSFAFNSYDAETSDRLIVVARR